MILEDQVITLKNVQPDQQMTMLKVLAEKLDEEIDLSDILQADDDAWKNATPGEFYTPLFL